MSKVTIYSPAGKNANQVELEGNTWKDLQKVLTKSNVSYSGMKAVIGENKHTLESENALLPDGDFTLFLMPIKTKSGAADRKALMATIKDFVTKNPSRKSDFIIDGKNMTQLSTSTLETLVAKHISGGMNGSSSTPSASAPVAEAAKKAAASVKEKAKEEAVVDYDVLIAAKKAEINELVQKGDYASVGTLGAEVAKLESEKAEAAKKAEEARLKAEADAKAAEKAVEKPKLNVDSLHRAAKELARDFKDVKDIY